MGKRRIYTLPVGTQPTGKIINKIIKDHMADTKKYTKLESYIDDEPIIERKTPNDILTIHNFAGYITKINVGYLLGNPVEYQVKDGLKIDGIVDAYNTQTISDLDAELAEDCSIFGRAYENVYVDEDVKVTSAKLDVYNTVVVYDNTFKHKKMFAINYTPQIDDKGDVVKEKYDVTIWTHDKITHHKLDKETLTDDKDQGKQPHYFGDVPVIEYVNNRRLRGDYETVITLIDAYNILQSDRVIDREKLVDAILAFYGAKITPEDQAAIKENRTVGLPTDSKAEYVIKNINEADADVLRATIASDIHKFSMTPDLTDDSFGGNPSGVSILYKLLAFEQNVKNKERYFESGLMNRFKLYNSFLSLKASMTSVDKKDVDATFKRSLPKNNLEISEMINNLIGTVDRKLLAGQLSFVENAAETVELAAKEVVGADGSYGTTKATGEKETKDE